MEEIELKNLFDFIKSKLYIVFLITILAIFCGIGYTVFIQTPLYKSYTTILLTKTNTNETINQSDIVLNQNLVSTYSEIIKSRNIVRSTIKELGLDYSIVELTNNINVSALSDTEIIKITVTDQDPKLASKIANTLASTFEEKIVDLYNIENIGIIDRAEASVNPYNVNIAKQLILSILIGLVLSFMLVFAMFYFDTTLKTPKEIEERIKLPLLGTVPKHERKR